MINDTNTQKTTIKAYLDKRVRQYYLKGLNSKEIGKLLDISARTVQRYIKDGNLKEDTTPKTIQQKAFLLHKQGFSYSQIGKKLRCSKTTIYTYMKKLKKVEGVT